MATLSIVTVIVLFAGAILYSIYQITHINHTPKTH